MVDMCKESLSHSTYSFVFRFILGVGWSWGHKVPCETKLQFCRVPCMGGIKLQLLCGVRIEMAVGSLPYLAWIPSRSLPIPLRGTQSTFLGRRGVTNTPTPWA